MRSTESLSGSDPDDAQLVTAVRHGDIPAFGQLVQRYQLLADAYARQLLDFGPAAEDMVQEAFLRAYRGLATLEQPERFGAWFKSILWRQCRNWVRSQRATVRPLDPELPAVAGDASWEASEEDPWLARLESTIEAMADGNRLALVLFYVLDIPQERIARFLDIPLGTVKRRLFDGRAVLAAAASRAQLEQVEQRRYVTELMRLLAQYTPTGVIP